MFLNKFHTLPLGFIGNLGIAEIFIILTFLLVPIILLIFIIQMLNKKRKK